jgi:phosphoribosylformylglycinamidine cyclo-ligase
VQQVLDILREGGETVSVLGEVIAAEGPERVVYNGHLELKL